MAILSYPGWCMSSVFLKKNLIFFVNENSKPCCRQNAHRFLFSPGQNLSDGDHCHKDDRHDGERVPEEKIPAERNAVEDESEQPKYGVPHIAQFLGRVGLEDEEIRAEDGNHRSEHRADEIQKSRDVVHGKENRAHRSRRRHDDRNPLSDRARDNRLELNARRICV